MNDPDINAVIHRLIAVEKQLAALLPHIQALEKWIGELQLQVSTLVKSQQPEGVGPEWPT